MGMQYAFPTYLGRLRYLRPDVNTVCLSQEDFAESSALFQLCSVTSEMHRNSFCFALLILFLKRDSLSISEELEQFCYDNCFLEHPRKPIHVVIAALVLPLVAFQCRQLKPHPTRVLRTVQFTNYLLHHCFSVATGARSDYIRNVSPWNGTQPPRQGNSFNQQFTQRLQHYHL